MKIQKKSSVLYSKLLVLSFVFLLVMSSVAAVNTVTLITPAADESISGTSYTLNATFDTNTFNATGVEFFYRLNNLGVWTSIATANNTSFQDLVFNTTWDTTSIIDDNAIAFSVNASNASGTMQGTGSNDTSTGVAVDNTNPTCTLANTMLHDGFSVSANQSLFVGISADTNGIDNCEVHFVRRDTSATTTVSNITASSNACSSTLYADNLGLVDDVNYNVIVECIDGNTDQTNASARLLKSLGAGGSAIVTTPQEKGNGFGAAVSNTAAGIKNTILSIVNKILSLFK